MSYKKIRESGKSSELKHLFHETNSKGKPKYTYAEIGYKLGFKSTEISAAVQYCVKHLKWEPRIKNIDRSYNKYLDMQREELLEEIRFYVSKDKAPNKLNYAVKKEFGNWTPAVIEALGVPNIGGFDKNKKTILYYLDFGNFIKIGITQQRLESRLNTFPKHTLLDYEELEYYEAIKLEKLLHSKLKQYDNSKLPDEFYRNGHTECFYKPKGNYPTLTSLEFL